MADAAAQQQREQRRSTHNDSSFTLTHNNDNNNKGIWCLGGKGVAWNIKYLCRLGTAATKVATRANNNAPRTHTYKQTQAHLHTPTHTHIHTYVYATKKSISLTCFALFLIFLHEVRGAFFLLFVVVVVAELSSALSFDWGCDVSWGHKQRVRESARPGNCLSVSLSLSLCACVCVCVCLLLTPQICLFISLCLLLLLLLWVASRRCLLQRVELPFQFCCLPGYSGCCCSFFFVVYSGYMPQLRRLSFYFLLFISLIFY